MVRDVVSPATSSVRALEPDLLGSKTRSRTDGALGAPDASA